MGIILYDTFWTSAAVFFRLVERRLEVPNLVGEIDARRRKEGQRMLVREAMPFYKLRVEIEKGFTSRDVSRALPADDGRDGVPGVLPA